MCGLIVYDLVSLFKDVFLSWLLVWVDVWLVCYYV